MWRARFLRAFFIAEFLRTVFWCSCRTLLLLIFLALKRILNPHVHNGVHVWKSAGAVTPVFY